MAVVSPGLPHAAFVGREADLAWLVGRVREAGSGRGRVCVIRGESGAGKTRLLDELARAALAEGLRVWMARAEASAPGPFGGLLPLIHDLMARGVRARATTAAWNRVTRAFRADAPLLQETLRPDAGAADAEFAVEFATALLERSRHGGLVLVLDDLPDFDRASVDLVRSLVATLSDAEAGSAPLAVVIGVRTPATSLEAQDLLRALGHELAVESRDLAGLDEAAVADLLASVGIEGAGRTLVAELHARTRGNPLHLASLARQLRASGAIRRTGGTWVLVRPPDEAMSSLAEVLRRGAMLPVSPGAGSLLAALAEAGGEIAVDSLAQLAGIESADAPGALAAALASGVLIEAAGRVRFAHALQREAVRAATPLETRQALHARLYAECAPDDVDRRALHGLLAGPLLPAASVLPDVTASARRAMTARDWPRAAAHFEAALGLAGEVRLPPEELAELHYRAGLAHFRSHDAPPAIERFEHARRLFLEAGERDGAAAAQVELMRSRTTLSRRAFGVELAGLDELEAAFLSPDWASPELRAYALGHAADARAMAGQPERALSLAAQALALAAGTEDDVVLAAAHANTGVVRIAALDLEGAAEAFRESIRYARRSDDPWRLAMPIQRLPIVLAWQGRLDETESYLLRAAALRSVTHADADYSLVLGLRAGLALARGELDEVETHAREAVRLGLRTGYPWGAAMALSARAAAAGFAGDEERAEEALALLERPGDLVREVPPALAAVAAVGRLRLAALAGRIGSAELERARGLGRLLSRAADPQTVGPLCACVDVAAAAGDAELAREAAGAIAPLAARGCVITAPCDDLLERALGVAARTCGDVEGALAHLERAVLLGERAGASALVARALLDLADLLAKENRPYERVAQRGTRLAQRLGLVALAGSRGASATEAAPRRYELPSVESGPPAQIRPSPREIERIEAISQTAQQLTVLVSDLAGSTLLFQRIGDAAARVLMADHNRVVRTALRTQGGAEIQQTGDGFILAFGDTDAALRCAVEVQREIAARVPDLRDQVRIGLHVGELVVEEDRLFGTAMNVAARICGSGVPGEIRISEAAWRRRRDRGLRAEALGPVALRGVIEPVSLHRVEWNSAPV